MKIRANSTTPSSPRSAPMMLLSLMAMLFVVVGCEKFDAPPQVLILNIEDGVLADPSAPIVLQFHEPVKDGSLAVRVVLVETSEEGDLLPEAKVFFDSTRPALGKGSLSSNRRRYTIDLAATLPVGPRLALEISPGLADDAGNTWTATQLIEFAFGIECDPNEVVPTTFPSAVHFILIDVEEPLAVQLQLIADIRVDAAAGTFIGTFTNADRDTSIDCVALGLSCAAEEVCRTLPEPACVLPSERALTTDEYPDFIHNNDPPSGYSFTAIGCARDQPDGSWAFTNVPIDVDVAMPEVRVVEIGLNASFSLGDEGMLRGLGSFTAADILLGALMASSGAATGSLSIRQVPPEQIKPGLPVPPAELPPAE